MPHGPGRRQARGGAWAAVGRRCRRYTVWPFPTLVLIVSAPALRCLLPHPALPPRPGVSVAVGVVATPAGLGLHYRVRADRQALRVPAPVPPGPADGLWRHTCCEAFVGDGDGGHGYHEFNFSPAGTWAAYRFTAMRQRDLAYRPPAVPRVQYRAEADGFTVCAEIPSALLPPGAGHRLGLTTVLEHADGSLSYWALRHDAAQPDFHQPATFLVPLDFV